MVFLYMYKPKSILVMALLKLYHYTAIRKLSVIVKLLKTFLQQKESEYLNATEKASKIEGQYGAMINVKYK